MVDQLYYLKTPMTVSDVVGIFQSDIDVHASTYSMHSGSFMNSIFGLTEPVFTGSGNPYDSLHCCISKSGYSQYKNAPTNHSKIEILIYELQHYMNLACDMLINTDYRF